MANASISNAIFDFFAMRSNTTNIFISCFPKSGSTYLTKLLSELTGFPLLPAVQFFQQNEQDIYQPALRYLCLSNSVTQQHMKGTTNNLSLLHKYNVSPVILTRNIYDVLISYYDHLHNESHKVPAAFIHDQFFSMSKEDKLNFLILQVLPWYFHFFVSWTEAASQMDLLWITYEDLFSDMDSTVASILNHYKLEVSQSIDSAIQSTNRMKTRKNKGITGRGTSLSPSHRELIKQLADSWHFGDEYFNSIGI